MTTYQSSPKMVYDIQCTTTRHIDLVSWTLHYFKSHGSMSRSLKKDKWQMAIMMKKIETNINTKNLLLHMTRARDTRHISKYAWVL